MFLTNTFQFGNLGYEWETLKLPIVWAEGARKKIAFLAYASSERGVELTPPLKNSIFLSQKKMLRMFWNKRICNFVKFLWKYRKNVLNSYLRLSIKINWFFMEKSHIFDIYTPTTKSNQLYIVLSSWWALNWVKQLSEDNFLNVSLIHFN